MSKQREFQTISNFKKKRTTKNYDDGVIGLEIPKKGYYMNFFNEMLLDLNILDLKQSLLINIGHVDLAFELLLICHSDSMQQPKYSKVKAAG